MKLKTFTELLSRLVKPESIPMEELMKVLETQKVSFKGLKLKKPFGCMQPVGLEFQSGDGYTVTAVGYNDGSFPSLSSDRDGLFPCRELPYGARRTQAEDFVKVLKTLIKV